MISIMVSIGMFVCAFFFQVILVRILKKLHIHPFISFVAFFVGFVIILTFIIPFSQTPLTALFTYVLLFLLLMPFSFIPQLGVKSPTSLIITQLQTKNTTLLQLQNLLNEKEQILLRINDLVDINLVKKNGERYIISQPGLFLARFISGLSIVMGIKVQDEKI